MNRFGIISFILFLVIGLVIYFYGKQNDTVDYKPLAIGNGVLWIVSLISFNIITQSINSGNGNQLMRAKMMGTILKFFAVIAMVLIYVFMNDRTLPHKGNIFIFLGIYVLYATVEAMLLAGYSRKK